MLNGCSYAHHVAAQHDSAGEGAGLDEVDQLFVLTMAAYNLTRMRTLGQIRPQGT